MRRSLIPSLLLISTVSLAAEPVTIGTRRELFVDDALVERLAGEADLRLHHPTPQNVALVTDAPWEGNATNYVTVFVVYEPDCSVLSGAASAVGLPHALYRPGLDRVGQGAAAVRLPPSPGQELAA